MFRHKSRKENPPSRKSIRNLHISNPYPVGGTVLDAVCLAGKPERSSVSIATKATKVTPTATVTPSRPTTATAAKTPGATANASPSSLASAQNFSRKIPGQSSDGRGRGRDGDGAATAASAAAESKSQSRKSQSQSQSQASRKHPRFSFDIASSPENDLSVPPVPISNGPTPPPALPKVDPSISSIYSLYSNDENNTAPSPGQMSLSQSQSRLQPASPPPGNSNSPSPAPPRPVEEHQKKEQHQQHRPPNSASPSQLSFDASQICIDYFNSPVLDSHKEEFPMPSSSSHGTTTTTTTTTDKSLAVPDCGRPCFYGSVPGPMEVSPPSPLFDVPAVPPQRSLTRKFSTKLKEFLHPVRSVSLAGTRSADMTSPATTPPLSWTKNRHTTAAAAPQLRQQRSFQAVNNWNFGSTGTVLYNSEVADPESNLRTRGGDSAHPSYISIGASTVTESSTGNPGLSSKRSSFRSSVRDRSPASPLTPDGEYAFSIGGGEKTKEVVDVVSVAAAAPVRHRQDDYGFPDMSQDLPSSGSEEVPVFLERTRTETETRTTVVVPPPPVDGKMEGINSFSAVPVDAPKSFSTVPSVKMDAPKSYSAVPSLRIEVPNSSFLNINPDQAFSDMSSYLENKQPRPTTSMPVSPSGTSSRSPFQSGPKLLRSRTMSSRPSASTAPSTPLSPVSPGLSRSMTILKSSHLSVSTNNNQPVGEQDHGRRSPSQFEDHRASLMDPPLPSTIRTSKSHSFLSAAAMSVPSSVDSDSLSAWTRSTTPDVSSPVNEGFYLDSILEGPPSPNVFDVNRSLPRSGSTEPYRPSTALSGSAESHRELKRSKSMSQGLRRAFTRKRPTLPASPVPSRPTTAITIHEHEEEGHSDPSPRSFLVRSVTTPLGLATVNGPSEMTLSRWNTVRQASRSRSPPPLPSPTVRATPLTPEELQQISRMPGSIFIKTVVPSLDGSGEDIVRQHMMKPRKLLHGGNAGENTSGEKKSRSCGFCKRGPFPNMWVCMDMDMEITDSSSREVACAFVMCRMCANEKVKDGEAELF